MSKAKTFIGTSGWHYKHWQGTFYPQDIKQKDYFNYYKDRFQTVELNNSFYKLPSTKTYQNWKDQAPSGFVFSVKGSRFLTHTKKLKPPIKENINRFMERVEVLKSKLGPILFQMPPAFKKNTERLQAFLDQLPKVHRYAFEFRNHDWYSDDIYETLKKYHAAFCIYELGGHQSPQEITANFVYLRLHGPADKYQGSYSDDTLNRWAKRFHQWKENGKDVYCYFDNDEQGYAAQNALRISELMEG